MKKHTILIISLSCILVGSCSSITYTGNSVTFDGDNILRNDIKKMLAMYERTIYQCRDIHQVNAKIIDVQTINGLMHVQEQWLLSACNRSHSFKITIKEDGSGGSFFTTSFPPKEE